MKKYSFTGSTRVRSGVRLNKLYAWAKYGDLILMLAKEEYL